MQFARGMTKVHIRRSAITQHSRPAVEYVVEVNVGWYFAATDEMASRDRCIGISVERATSEQVMAPHTEPSRKVR